MVRRILFGCATVAVVIAFIPAAARAQAPADVIVITAAGSPASDAGELAITFDSTTPIVPSSIEAALYAPGASIPTLTVTDFTQTSGSTTSGGVSTWTVTSPISQEQLALGTYSITVQASDTGGGSVTVPDAGALAFVIYPTVTLSVSPTTFSYGQTVTLSGTDTGLYPGGTTAPVVGQQITTLGTLSTTTDASGDFSFTVQAGVGQGEYLALGDDVDANPDATTAQAFSNLVTPTVVADPVQLTYMLSPSPVSFDQALTISGNLSFESGSTWLPIPATALTLQQEGNCDDGNGCPSWTTETSGGNFILPSFQVTWPAHYGLSGDLPGGSYSDWFSMTWPVLQITPDHLPVGDYLDGQWPSAPGSFIRSTRTKQVVFSACVAVADPGYGNGVYDPDPAPFPNVTVEYSPTAAGPWHVLATGKSSAVKLQENPIPGGCYTGSAKRPGPASYYYQAITPADTAYLAGYSAPVQATQPAQSEVSYLDVTPTKVKAGQPVSVSGQLTFSSKNDEQKTQWVRIYFQAAGTKTWRLEKKFRAGYLDTFDVDLKLPTSGKLEVRYLGDPYNFPCTSQQVTVTVTKK